jgi:hypothetical protein
MSYLFDSDRQVDTFERAQKPQRALVWLFLSACSACWVIRCSPLGRVHEMPTFAFVLTRSRRSGMLPPSFPMRVEGRVTPINPTPDTLLGASARVNSKNLDENSAMKTKSKTKRTKLIDASEVARPAAPKVDLITDDALKDSTELRLENVLFGTAPPLSVIPSKDVLDFTLDNVADSEVCSSSTIIAKSDFSQAISNR